MKKSLMLSMFMALSLIAVGCFEDGKDGSVGATGSSGPTGPKGDTGDTGASGQDALISSNSYSFTPEANPYTEPIAEINLAGVEAGWQTVTVWMWIDPVWLELNFTVGDGTTVVDYLAFVGDGGVRVEVMEDLDYNEPPTGGYDDYMVIVQTFAH